MCGADIPPGQACNSVLDRSAAITPACMTGTLPAGTGGTIVDGTYHLTAQTYYNVGLCPTIALSGTLVVAGGCEQIVVDTPVVSPDP
jgi:hypothetical protein